MTQPALSQQIKRLELQLGVRPALPLASLKPVVRAFRQVARDMTASGSLAQT